MIIIVLIMNLIVFVTTNIFAKKTWQTFLSLIFVRSLILIVANLSNHFGITEVTETKSTKIVSSTVSDDTNILL